MFCLTNVLSGGFPKDVLSFCIWFCSFLVVLIFLLEKNRTGNYAEKLLVQLHAIVFDVLGELDDDREELLAAANFACNASCMSYLTLISFYRKYYAVCKFAVFVSACMYMLLLRYFAPNFHPDLACSNSFWKKMELIFSSSFEDITYLRQQVITTMAK